MVAYTYKMPSGIAGNVSRPDHSTIEACLLDATTPPTAYGVPVKFVSGKVKPITTGDVSSSVAGFLVRQFPMSGNGTDGLGTATPNASLSQSIMRRGYMNVVVNGSTAPAQEGQVYVRINDAGVSTPLGGIEAAANWTVGTATAGGGNTGNGTVSAVTQTGTETQAGTYRLTAVTATHFQVTRPDGDRLKNLVVGTAYDTDLALTITAGGTPFVAGDTFTIVVTANTIKVPNAFFCGARDSNNNAEIRYNI